MSIKSTKSKIQTKKSTKYFGCICGIIANIFLKNKLPLDYFQQRQKRFPFYLIVKIIVDIKVI